MNVWFISDTHFSHSNILEFINYDGQQVRPGFDNVEQMDQLMIDNWNSVIKPRDKVYHLGDVGFNKPRLDVILSQLNGKKRLILGNHDQYPMEFYSKHFHKIMVSWRPMRSLIFSHFPLHIGADDPKLQANVHGHIHRQAIADHRYLNLSVEMTDYKPVHYDQIITHFANQGIHLR